MNVDNPRQRNMTSLDFHSVICHVCVLTHNILTLRVIWHILHAHSHNTALA